MNSRHRNTESAVMREIDSSVLDVVRDGEEAR